jgi:hypothetical protein
MILNTLEVALMNDPLRAAVQRGYEGRVLGRPAKAIRQSGFQIIDEASLLGSFGFVAATAA